MNFGQVSIANIKGIEFVCDPSRVQCMLNDKWAHIYLPTFTGGYRVISAMSPYGGFDSMQWFSVVSLPPGVDAVFGSSWLDEYNRYIVQHQQQNLVQTVIYSLLHQKIDQY